MKQFIEKVRVAGLPERKEVMPLDFDMFFYLSVNMTKNMMMTDPDGIQPSLHLYSGVKQSTKTFLFYTKKDEYNKFIKKAMLAIMSEQSSPYDYYATISEGWMAADSSIQEELDAKGYEEGDITRLPDHKRIEVFSIFGKSKDGQSKMTAYIINRANNDFKSKIISFEEIKDSKHNEGYNTKSGWLPAFNAELTRKQLRHLGELVCTMKNGKEYVVQTSTRFEEEYSKYLKTNTILLPVKNNRLPFQPSVLGYTADLYSVAYGIEPDNLESVTVFILPKLQRWLKENMHKYEIISDHMSDKDNKLMRNQELDFPIEGYELEQCAVPLGDIPSDIIFRPE